MTFSIYVSIEIFSIIFLLSYISRNIELNDVVCIYILQWEN